MVKLSNIAKFVVPLIIAGTVASAKAECPDAETFYKKEKATYVDVYGKKIFEEDYVVPEKKIFRTTQLKKAIPGAIMKFPLERKGVLYMINPQNKLGRKLENAISECFPAIPKEAKITSILVKNNNIVKVTYLNNGKTEKTTFTTPKGLYSLIDPMTQGIPLSGKPSDIAMVIKKEKQEKPSYAKLPKKAEETPELKTKETYKVPITQYTNNLTTYIDDTLKNLVTQGYDIVSMINEVNKEIKQSEQKEELKRKKEVVKKKNEEIIKKKEKEIKKEVTKEKGIEKKEKEYTKTITEAVPGIRIISRVNPFSYEHFKGEAETKSDYLIVPIKLEGSGFNFGVDYLRILFPYRIDLVVSGNYGELLGKEIHKLQEDFIYNTKTIKKELSLGPGLRILDNKKNIIEGYVTATLQHGIHTSKDEGKIVSVNDRFWAIGPEVGFFGKHKLGILDLEWNADYFNLQGRQRLETIIDLSKYNLPNNITRDREHTRIYGAEAWIRALAELGNFYLGGEASARYSQMKDINGKYTHQKDYSVDAILGGKPLNRLNLEAVIGYTHSRGASSLELNGINAGLNLNFEY